MEIYLDATVARGIVATGHSRPRAARLVIGYKAVQRALDLDSDDVSLKLGTHSYEY